MAIPLEELMAMLWNRNILALEQIVLMGKDVRP
jgi:hypothetical protein